MTNQSQNTGLMSHPKGLRTLFMTEMWERFSYYGMRAILILFMTTEVAKEGMGLDEETAGAIYGLYTAGVYLFTLPGGWIADNILGQQKAVWYGGILIMIGHLLLAIPGSNAIFFSGLVFVATGTGLLKPNISTMVGDLYPEGGARRDAGFSIFYMGINIGSFLGQACVSLLGEKVNWHYGFGLAAIGMLFGIIQFRLTSGALNGIGVAPKAKEDTSVKLPTNKSLTILLSAFLIILIAVAQFTGYIELTTARGFAEAVGFIIVSVTVIYFLNILVSGGLNTEDKKKVAIIFLLFLGSAVFWAGFEQAGSTLNLFARDYTDRFLGGFELPAGMLQNVNPGFIIIFAPILGSIWVKLSMRNLNPSTPVKFGIGLFLMAMGFFMMFLAAQIVVESTGKASMLWLVATYFFHSVGEITLSPIGLSATTQLSPKRYTGQMMGIWFVGTSVGNLIAGLFAGGFDSESSASLPPLFMSVVQLGVGAGIIFFILTPWIKKWMGNVN